MTIRAVVDSIEGSAHEVRMAWVDDCSFDDSAARAEAETADWLWVEVVRLAERSGASIARNEGMRVLAYSDVFVFLDAHSVCQPTQSV